MPRKKQAKEDPPIRFKGKGPHKLGFVGEAKVVITEDPRGVAIVAEVRDPRLPRANTVAIYLDPETAGRLWRAMQEAEKTFGFQMPPGVTTITRIRPRETNGSS